MKFETEAALCQAFIALCPKQWVVYPETGGFDILLVHAETGTQIGIEAKLVLNPKVLHQIIGYYGGFRAQAPDFRAVLVGSQQHHMREIAAALGIQVLAVTDRSGRPRIWPEIPVLVTYERWGERWLDRNGWVDEAPTVRVILPDYVPQVPAGVAAPRKLSAWTIAAIKLCQIVEARGTVTRQTFDGLHISPSRWCNGYWLSKARRGHWAAGPAFPGPRFRDEHPVTWDQIAADWSKWAEPILGKMQVAEKPAR
jgi:hypothetical protein